MNIRRIIHKVGPATVVVLAVCLVAAQSALKQQDSTAKRRSLDAAERYLEELQKSSWSGSESRLVQRRRSGANPIPTAEFERLIWDAVQQFKLTPSEEAEFRQRIINRKERFHSLRPNSPYEDPRLYQTIEFWSEKIRVAARRSFPRANQLNKTNVLFGTLPTGEVNALSVVVPSVKDTYLIVFESGFFEFADVMARAFVNTLPLEQQERGYSDLSTNPAAVSKYLAQHRELQERFLRVIMAYLVEARFDTLPAEYYQTDVAREVIVTRLYESMGLFVLGHEYGHLLRGDLSGNGLAGAVSGQKIQMIPHAWKQELGADEIGIQLTYLVMKGPKSNLATILFGADFFLRCYEIVERSASLIANDGSHNMLPGSDHPPTSNRRLAVQQALHKFLQETYRNEFSEQEWNSAVKAASEMGQVMEQLYAATEVSLKKFHERGIELAPNWRRRVAGSK